MSGTDGGPEDVRQLRAIGVHLGQGRLFGAPVAPGLESQLDAAVDA